MTRFSSMRCVLGLGGTPEIAILRGILRAALVCGLLASVAACNSPGEQDQVADYPAAPVIYAHLGPGNTQLIIADGDGRNAIALFANPAFDYNPSLSADGQWVIFTSERGGSPDIYRVRVDGTGLEQLTDDLAYDDYGVMSPDGDRLAFVSTRGGGNANIWLLDLASRELTNLTPGSPGDYRPAWSPDGSQIAFSSIRDAQPLAQVDDPATQARVLSIDIYVMRWDGTEVRRLTATGAMFTPAWSLDGGKIAFVQGPPPTAPAPGAAQIQPVFRIASIDVVDGLETILAEMTGQAMRPLTLQWVSASRVVYVTPRGVQYTDGTAGELGEFRSADWSVDGRKMVSHRELLNPLPESTLPAGTPPGLLNEMRLNPAFGSPAGFRISTARDPGFRVMRTGIFPSGRRLQGSGEIVMNDLRAGAAPNSIIAVSADGMTRRVVFAPEFPKRAVNPMVSPDGADIAFAIGDPGFAVERGTSRLALMRADGSEYRELAEAGEHAAYPAWSPDGTRLVFVVAQPADERGLAILDLASGTVTRLTAGPDNFPAWSPSDDRIAFTRAPRSIGGASQIFTVRPDGTGLVRLTLAPGAQDAHPAWSPDGRWIAFTSSRLYPRDESGVTGSHHFIGQIFVMRSDGSDVRQLTDTTYNTGTPAWLE